MLNVRYAFNLICSILFLAIPAAFILKFFLSLFYDANFVMCVFVNWCVSFVSPMTSYHKHSSLKQNIFWKLRGGHGFYWTEVKTGVHSFLALGESPFAVLFQLLEATHLF